MNYHRLTCRDEACKQIIRREEMADNAYLAVFGVVACFFLTLLKRQNARRKFALAVHLKSVQRHRALILLEQRRQNNKTNLHEKIKR